MQEASTRSPAWVSKTDLVRYVRCPYAFWLLDRGDIAFEDTVDEFQVSLLNDGVAFQRLFEAAAAPIEVGPEGIAPLLAEDHRLVRVPLFENARLEIYGQPDGIDTARGALFPIEIKSHKDVQSIDELELAFYWLLLQPYRTRGVEKPLGYLVLRRNGSPERVEVPIRQRRFKEVRRLVNEVRIARRQGVLPRACGCVVCSSLRREEVHRVTRERKDLTLISGIGRAYASALEEMGLSGWDSLLDCDPATIVTGMRARGYGSLGAAELERWRQHALSWQRQGPVHFGPGPDVGDSFIALDLEFGRHIWLIGACRVTTDRREYLALWADDPDQEKKNLLRLSEFLTAQPALPVVTWNGQGADLPQLRSAAQRLGLQGAFDPPFARHVDLYVYARRYLRLPTPGLSLKEVAAYFGIPRVSKVTDGLAAELLYRQYRRTEDRHEKVALQEQLTDYNRDDVDNLIGTAERIRELREPLQ